MIQTSSWEDVYMSCLISMYAEVAQVHLQCLLIRNYPKQKLASQMDNHVLWRKVLFFLCDDADMIWFLWWACKFVVHIGANDAIMEFVWNFHDATFIGRSGRSVSDPNCCFCISETLLKSKSSMRLSLHMGRIEIHHVVFFIELKSSYNARWVKISSIYK